MNSTSLFFRRLFQSNWVVGILALAEIILGFILLSIPYILGMSIILLAGFVLILMGIARLITALRTRYELLWNGLCALGYIILGAMMLLAPLDLLRFVTLAAACLLITLGSLRLLLAVISRHRKHVIWRTLNGTISLALGIIVCSTWPESSQWFIGVMVAIEMIFSGWTLLFLSVAAQGEKPDALKQDG